MFEVVGWHKEAFLDSYANGETGQVVSFNGNERFASDTIEGLVKQLDDMVWGQYVQIGVNESDEIIIERMENGNGDRVEPDSYEYRGWQAGEFDLWVARYYFNVEETVRKPAQLEYKEYELS
jgi:hypothetical protein